MGDLGVISNQLRGLSDKSSFLAAEGLNEIQSQLEQVYVNFWFSDSLTANHAGFRIGAIQTNLLEILGDSLEPQMRISGLDDQTGDVLIEMDEARIKFLHPSAFAATADGIYTNFGPSKYQIVAGALGAAFQLESTVVAGVYTTELVMFVPTGSAFGGLHVAAADIYLLLSNGTYSIKADTTPASASLRVAGPTQDFTISPTAIIPSVNLSGALGSSTRFLSSAYVATYNIYNTFGNANTFLSISGSFDKLFLSAFSSSGLGAAGRIGLSASNAAASFSTTIDLDGAAKSISLVGHTDILNDSLSATGLKIKDASGTTTGNSFEIQKNDGTVIFKVVGSTDASTPGTVFTRNIIPLTDLTYKIGDSTHNLTQLWASQVEMVGPSTVHNGGTLSIASGGVFNVQSGSSFNIDTQVLPVSSGSVDIGDVTHKWRGVYVGSLEIYGSSHVNNGGTLNIQSGGSLSINGTATVIAPSGAAGVTFSGAVATLTVSGGIVTGHT